MVSIVLQESDGVQEWEEFRLEMNEVLAEQGYQPLEINLALSIAQRIHDQLMQTEHPSEPIKSNRIFQMLEEQKLTPQARGYLNDLLQRGYVTALGRMEIVDKLIMLDEGPIDRDLLKQYIEMYVEEEGPDEDNCWLPPTLH
jgi:uncharacterized protein Smg (DUF494 family)